MSMATFAPSAMSTVASAVTRYGSSLASLASAASRRFGDRTALIHDGWHPTFDELWTAARSLANGVYGLGVLSPRYPIVVSAEGPILPIALLAAGRLGLDIMPANPRREGDELRRVVAPRSLLIHDGERPAWHEGPSLSTEAAMALLADGPGSLGHSKRKGRLVLLTSGTTGAPTRHVRKTMSFQTLRQLFALYQRVGVTGVDTVLGLTPLFHGHGIQLFASTLLTGAPLVLAPRASAAQRLDLARRSGSTVASGLPAQFERICDELDASESRPPSLRRIVCGSEPLSPALIERLTQHFGPIVMNCYGTTETGTVTAASPGELAARPGTVGRPLGGVDVGIVGARGQDDAVGRLWVRAGGSTIITGDLGRREDGYFWVTGRADD